MITLAKATEISALKIDGLRPEFKIRVHDWFEACCQLGLVPYVYEGFRSLARQAELYELGRTRPGKIVTNAGPGQSFHNYGLAFDWVPLKRVEKAAGMYEADWDNEPMYAVGADQGKRFKLRALSWETPHLEDDTFGSWRELKEKFGQGTTS